MIKKDQDEKLSARKRIGLLGLKRSTCYYRPRMLDDHDLRLMRAIDQINMSHPCFGSRRIMAVLRSAGWDVGRDHVRRLMRMMRIFAIYPKKRTTIPNKEHKVYPYLLRNRVIDRPNQVWCTDITYIPMAQGFTYLVAIMDWHSRCVLAWRLSTSLDASFCIEALKEALQNYGAPEIFNSDQGSQFTSTEFVEVLVARGISISMDSKGRFYDNIFIERLWRSLKQEEVYLNAYENVKECRRGIGSFIKHYNTERPHQALKYQTPSQVYGLLQRAAS